MAHSFDNLIRNFNKQWMNFRFYFLRAIYYGLVPGMFIYGKQGITLRIVCPRKPNDHLSHVFFDWTGNAPEQHGTLDGSALLSLSLIIN